MIKLITFVAILFSSNEIIHKQAVNKEFAKEAVSLQNRSIYDFKVLALNGDTIDFASFKTISPMSFN